MKPDAPNKYNPSPDYWRELIAKTGLSQRAAAELCGVSARSMREYLHRGKGRGGKSPYSVQFALEALAESKGRQP